MTDALTAALVGALSAAAGAYSGADLRKKAEGRALKEDIEALVEQLKKTTAAPEEIRARFTGGLWLEQSRLTSLDKLYKELLGEVGVLTSALFQAMGVARFAANTTDASKLKRLQEFADEYDRIAAQAWKRLVRCEAVARPWLGSEAHAALDKFADAWRAAFGSSDILGGAQAWTAQGQGNKSDALKFMRAAADLEDASEKHVAMENRLYPMRELLADMLMTQGEGTAALKEYETSLKNAPRRLRGFYGAAKAAEASGDVKRARAYFEKLAGLTPNADGDRPELRETKQRLASK